MQEWCQLTLLPFLKFSRRKPPPPFLYITDMEPATTELVPDTDLIRRTLGGNLDAFATLVARYERSMFIIARSVLTDRQIAEDATQDAFLAAYRALPSLKNPAAFGAWLAIIVRRRAQELSRTRLHLAPLADDLPEPRNPALDFDSERLLAAVLELPDPERQALLLRHFENLDFAAIAQITGESTGTVTKRVSRAHARLRQLLKEYQS
jgi:RNA polymerase sigma-70 factor, ECF subfamily